MEIFIFLLPLNKNTFYKQYLIKETTTITKSKRLITIEDNIKISYKVVSNKNNQINSFNYQLTLVRIYAMELKLWVSYRRIYTRKTP